MLGTIIDLPKVCDPRGNLTVAEQLSNVPFEVSRVYWVYDVPGERAVEDMLTSIARSLSLP